MEMQQGQECGKPTMFPGKKCALEAEHRGLCSPFPRRAPAAELNDPKAARAATFERLAVMCDAMMCYGCNKTHARGDDEHSENQPIKAIVVPCDAPCDAHAYCLAAFMALPDEEAVRVSNAVQDEMVASMKKEAEAQSAQQLPKTALVPDAEMPPEQMARAAFRKFLRERGTLDSGACGCCERGAPARVGGTCENCWAMLRCASCEHKVACEFHKVPETTPEQRQQAFMAISVTHDAAACKRCGKTITVSVDSVCGACFVAGTPPGERAPAPATRLCALCGKGGQAHQIAGSTGNAVCEKCVKEAAGLVERGEEKDRAQQWTTAPNLSQALPVARDPVMPEARELALAIIAKARAITGALTEKVNVEQADAIMTLVEAADRAMGIGR